MGKIGTSINKTVVSIAAITFLQIIGMEYDQYRPATLFKNKLIFIHVVLQSL
jgi:hypothetical protein